MCILFLAIEAHPDYALILAANRDEYFARPSEPMHFWPDHPDILAGRDMQAGGTWLGLNRRGSFAAVTNFRSASAQRIEAYSRGELGSRFLDRPDDTAFDRYLNAQYMQYNPFNIVFGNSFGIRAWDHGTRSSRVLGSGFHSVSNGSIDQPWPKMARGVDRLRQYLEQGDKVKDENIIEMMQDRTRAETHQLPETGLDISREQSLSSIFVEGERYGTRTTTVMKFSAYSIEISELNYLPGGEAGDMQRYTVQLPH